MKALLVPVGGYPLPIDIEGLSDLQQAVGGTIDAVGWVFDDAPELYVNDEGKFRCAPNRAVYATEDDAGRRKWDGSETKEGELLDVIFGDFVAIGFDPDTGEDRDITEAEAEKVVARFGSSRSIESGLVEAMRIGAGVH